MNSTQDDGRPDPDALLAEVDPPAADSRGRLKIFLGMCPGVGKTYAMLENARRLQAQGVQVLVGVAETHGREETARLLEGLPIQSKQRIAYRDTELEEMDLDRILAARPEVVLVDELAHTNVSGSRHPKRYQDVKELLAAGIDVHTTLNVQHLESLRESVEQITGIRVRETVPDQVLDEADDVELIDLSPGELRQRLQEGKVYMGERATLAGEHFFRESNLRALRELAVRKVADWVDRDLRLFMGRHRMEGPSHTRPRLLVAVGPSPYSERLVRITRQMAASMDATWIALHIETGDEPGSEGRERLSNSLNLARSLGAEILTVAEVDLVEGILQVARREHVSHLVVGKPTESGLLQRLLRNSMADRLIRASGQADILLIAPSKEGSARDGSPHPVGNAWEARVQGIRWQDYLTVTWIFIGCMALAFPVKYFLSYQQIPLLFMLVIVVAGLFLSRGAMLTLAIAAALGWNFFFTRPVYTFGMISADDLLHMILFMAVALVTGQLTSRFRSREMAWKRGEAQAQALYKLTRAIAASPTKDQAVQVILNQIRAIFDSPGALLTRDDNGRFKLHEKSLISPSPKDQSIAQIAFDSGEMTGRGTETLPEAEFLHLPLVSSGKVWAILSVKPPAGRECSPDRRDFLQAIAHHLTVVLEKDELSRISREGEVSRRSETLQRALLDNVSHELKTPLAVIQSCRETLEKQLRNCAAGDEVTLSVLDDLAVSSTRLTRVVNHLLEMSRLEGGLVEPQFEYVDAEDLLNELDEEHRKAFKNKDFSLQISDDLPAFPADPRLLLVALGNLLDNAAIHTPPTAKVVLGADYDASEGNSAVEIWVRDNGPGLPVHGEEPVIQRFSRKGDGATGGIGLGLSIAKSFTEAQGGTFRAENLQPHGAKFTIRLSLREGGKLRSTSPNVDSEGMLKS